MSISGQPKETEEKEQKTEEKAPDKEAEEDTTKIDKGHFKKTKPLYLRTGSPEALTSGTLG